MDRIISDRYAEALFSLAVENNAIDRYEEQVKLVLDVISGDKEIMKILTHPDINGEDKNAVIQKGIEAMENFFRQIEMPTDLGGLNIEVSEDQMKELALKCSHFGKRTIGCVKKLNQEDIYRIYQKAAD